MGGEVEDWVPWRGSYGYSPGPRWAQAAFAAVDVPSPVWGALRRSYY